MVLRLDAILCGIWDKLVPHPLLSDGPSARFGPGLIFRLA